MASTGFIHSLYFCGLASSYRQGGYISGVGTIITYVLILFAYRMERVSYAVTLREFSVVIGSARNIIFLKGVGILLIVNGLLLFKAF
ncbi:MAG: hypothetical protein DRP87_06655 [Spirochaetes bacterium]|nr:MAG: hypothetical protein DRP87_06655 [Spirochaetota bacterium]